MKFRHMRGALTMEQFMVLDFHLFPHNKPANGWPPPEHEQQVDTDDLSWRYVQIACGYLVWGWTYKKLALHAGRDYTARSKERARQMVGKFVRINADVLEEKHGLHS